MDLRSKLGLYREGTGSSSVTSKHNSGCDKSRDIDVLIPGRIQTNEYGSFYVIENNYPLTQRHGGVKLEEAIEAGADVLAALGGADCEGLQAGRLLYLDTETTGLSGGAGTIAFLVGTGFFGQDTFTVRQYFMRDYDEEAAVLYELQQLFSAYQGFATFNGKAFDINLLQSRFVSNRFRPSFGDMPDLDLLYPSRRVWGLKLESCRLSSLEESILGEFRDDDIPGALIPSVYFKYLEERDASQIKRVIRHNELDVLSMVSLLARLSAMMRNPLSETDGSFELLGMGRLFEANGNTDDMLECLEACTGSEHFSVRMQAVKRLSGVYKRDGRYDLALGHWKSIDAENPEFELFHLVELAKYYEHKVKDPSLAMQIVEKALRNCLNAGLSGSRQYHELKKRSDRLARKIKK